MFLCLFLSPSLPLFILPPFSLLSVSLSLSMFAPTIDQPLIYTPYIAVCSGPIIGLQTKAGNETVGSEVATGSVRLCYNGLLYGLCGETISDKIPQIMCFSLGYLCKLYYFISDLFCFFPFYLPLFPLPPLPSPSFSPSLSPSLFPSLSPSLFPSLSPFLSSRWTRSFVFNTI